MEKRGTNGIPERWMVVVSWQRQRIGGINEISEVVDLSLACLARSTTLFAKAQSVEMGMIKRCVCKKEMIGFSDLSSSGVRETADK